MSQPRNDPVAGATWLALVLLALGGLAVMALNDGNLTTQLIAGAVVAVAFISLPTVYWLRSRHK